LAFYVPHFFLIHALSVLLGVLQGFDARQLMTIFFYYPKGYGIGLPGVYAVWILVVALLYPFCRWVASVKARRRDWWLSYASGELNWTAALAHRRGNKWGGPALNTS